MTGKTVILENVSKRLWVVGAGIRIVPTAAVEVPEEVYKSDSVQAVIEDGELVVADAVKEPQLIKTEEEARKVQNAEKRGNRNQKVK